jgi:hypothetical protein
VHEAFVFEHHEAAVHDLIRGVQVSTHIFVWHLRSLVKSTQAKAAFRVSEEKLLLEPAVAPVPFVKTGLLTCAVGERFSVHSSAAVQR